MKALAVASHKDLPTETTTLGTSGDIAERAPRPHDLRMDVNKIEDVFGIRMPDLAEEVAKL